MWRFDNELSLEEFVYPHLPSLFGLRPLARQHSSEGQFCDILSVDAQNQLAILELKNGEDRYIVQQLTRYYDSIVQQQPFPEQIDYSLSIRLIAVAPVFHAHNWIDQRYSRLSLEFFKFQLLLEGDRLWFELTNAQTGASSRLEIPERFRFYCSEVVSEEVPSRIRKIPLPPKSLQGLMESLSPAQQDFLLQIRSRILSFDEGMMEVGKTTSTQYGLRKGERDLYQSKRCAQFLPVVPSIPPRPRLLVQLPYPKKEVGALGRSYKKERVKGMTWVELWQDDPWHETTNIKLLFYFGKGYNRYSQVYTPRAYASVYQNLTGKERRCQSLSDLVDMALEEWQLSATPV